MNARLLAASLTACIAASSALAADLPSRKAPIFVAPPPVFTWTGFHLGINAGATFGGSSTIRNVTAPIFNNGTATAVALQGVVGGVTTAIIPVGRQRAALLGVQAGYDHQFANAFVLGIEADVQGVIGASQRNVFGALGVSPVGGGFSVASSTVASKRLDWLGTVRGRLGYLVTPSFLLYATGGLAFGGVKASSATTASFGGAAAGVTPSSGQGGYSDNRVGYAAGAGIEYMFRPGWSVKAEYLYYDLRSATFSGGAITGATTGTLGTIDAIRTRVKYDGHISRAGVNYRFWGTPVAPVVARY